MSPQRRWAVHAVAALALGTGAGGAAAAVVEDRRADAVAREAAARDDLLALDRVASVRAGLLEDGVVVTDDGRSLLDEAGEDAVAEAVAASPERVFVLVWAPGQEIGASDLDVLDALAAALGPERGVLYVWEGSGEGDVEFVGDERGSVPGFATASDLVGEAAVTLPDAVRAVADTDWYDTSGSDYYGGLGGGALLGLLVTVMVVPGALVLAWLAARARGAPRLPGRWGWKEQA